MTDETVRYTMLTAVVQDGIWMRAIRQVPGARRLSCARQDVFPVRPQGGSQDENG